MCEFYIDRECGSAVLGAKNANPIGKFGQCRAFRQLKRMSAIWRPDRHLGPFRFERARAEHGRLWTSAEVEGLRSFSIDNQLDRLFAGSGL